MHTLLLLLLVLIASGTAFADEDHDAAFRLREQGKILPLEQLLARMQLGEGARLLEVEAKERHRRQLYEVEYLDLNGRVHELVVDARTGEILKRED
jgi:uncharacterized membrane protein YkoI